MEVNEANENQKQEREIFVYTPSNFLLFNFLSQNPMLWEKSIFLIALYFNS